MCGFVGEINFETPQQNKIFNTNLKLKDRGPDSQKIGYVDKNLQFNISENFSVDSKINIGFSKTLYFRIIKVS